MFSDFTEHRPNEIICKIYLLTELTPFFNYRYTYGKPVKGIADVRIKSKWPQYNWINNARVRVNKDIELQLPVSVDSVTYLA